MKKLSTQLREAIANCGMSNYRVARRSRIHQSQVSRFLSGESKLTLDTVDKIGVSESPRQHGEISESRTRSHTEQ